MLVLMILSSVSPSHLRVFVVPSYYKVGTDWPIVWPTLDRSNWSISTAISGSPNSILLPFLSGSNYLANTNENRGQPILLSCAIALLFADERSNSLLYFAQHHLWLHERGQQRQRTLWKGHWNWKRSIPRRRRQPMSTCQPAFNTSLISRNDKHS